MQALQKMTLALMLSLLLTGCGQSGQQDKAESPLEVAVVKVAEQDVPLDITALGQVESPQAVVVEARVEGILLKKLFAEGEYVEAGTLLYLLDSAPYEANLAEAEAAASEAQANLKQAKLDLERIRTLRKRGAVSQKELDDATTGVSLAKARLQARSAKLSKAELELGYTRIAAPISGIVGQRLVAEGNLVRPGVNSALTTITRTDPVYVGFSLSDIQVQNVHRLKERGELLIPGGADIGVSLQLGDGSTYPVAGHINFTDVNVDPATGTVRGRASFANPDQALLPGQFAKVGLDGVFQPQAIAIPQRAVQQGATGKFVYVVDKESRVSLRNITVGRWYKNLWLVQQGLTSGDQVIVNNLLKLREGMPVAIKPV